MNEDHEQGEIPFDPKREDYEPQNEVDEILSDGCQFRIIGQLLIMILTLIL